jgi:hypothetical protein
MNKQPKVSSSKESSLCSSIEEDIYHIDDSIEFNNMLNSINDIDQHNQTIQEVKESSPETTEEVKKYKIRPEYINNKYINPENANDIIEEITKITDHDEIHNLIIKTFPDWILYSTSSYSEDYKYLHTNWVKVCEMTKMIPRHILLVDFISFEPEFAMLSAFCNIMTSFGYCVRRKEEFGACSVCNKAIPNKILWQQMINNKMPVPEQWSNTCTTCL